MIRIGSCISYSVMGHFLRTACFTIARILLPFKPCLNQALTLRLSNLRNECETLSATITLNSLNFPLGNVHRNNLILELEKLSPNDD